MFNCIILIFFGLIVAPVLKPVVDKVEVERNSAITISFSLLRAYPQILANSTAWRKDNESIEYTSNKYSVSIDMLSLTIYNVEVSDEGIYTIEVTNVVASTSSSITMEVFGEAIKFILHILQSVCNSFAYNYRHHARLYSAGWKQCSLQLFSPWKTQALHSLEEKRTTVIEQFKNTFDV